MQILAHVTASIVVYADLQFRSAPHPLDLSREILLLRLVDGGSNSSGDIPIDLAQPWLSANVTQDLEPFRPTVLSAG